MSKHDIEMIFEKLSEIHEDVKKINEEKIPELRVQQATLETRVMTEAKVKARVYGAIYGGITLLVSLAGLAVAYWKHN